MDINKQWELLTQLELRSFEEHEREPFAELSTLIPKAYPADPKARYEMMCDLLDQPRWLPSWLSYQWYKRLISPPAVFGAVIIALFVLGCAGQ